MAALFDHAGHAALIPILAAMAGCMAPAGADVRLQGPTDDRMLRALLKGVGGGQRTFVISSRGGRERDAIEISSVIERAQVSLVVEDACTSACALYLLPAARQVNIKSGALVAFHINSYGLLRMRGLDKKRLPNLLEMEATANAARDMYMRRGLAVHIFEDATAVMRPICVIYHGTGARLISELDTWVPSRSYLRSAGYRVEGFWPKTADEARELTFLKLGSRDRIQFGEVGLRSGAKYTVRDCQAMMVPRAAPQTG
jgi:hypothetical protein